LRLRRLAIMLERLVAGFPQPSRMLEQYRTPAELALRAALLLPSSCRVVVDLGAGTGMLTYASSLLGHAYTVGLDVDAKALLGARSSPLYSTLVADFVEADAAKPPLRRGISCLCVIQNPPFGLSGARGMDRVFVEAAAGLGAVAVVSFHHAGSGTDFIERLYASVDYSVAAVEAYRFPIPQLYPSHRRKTFYTKVLLVKAVKRGRWSVC